MSPKSRGRRNSGGRAKRQHRPDRPVRPVRELRLSDRLMRAASEITDAERNVFDVEYWASGWLGQAWLQAGISERQPEHLLCTEVAGRARSRPSAAGLAAVAALRRVARRPNTPCWTRRSRCCRSISRHHAGSTRPSRARSPRGARSTCGTAAAWEQHRDADEVPMPLSPAPVDDVLAELADALRFTDMTWPRQDDEDFVDLRELAWSRGRSHLPDFPGIEEVAAAEDAVTASRPQLVEEFLRLPVLSTLDQDVAGSLAELFLDYGQGYIRSGPLAWSPAHVALFLSDWLPRKAVLDSGQRTALLAALRAWLRFALTHRGVQNPWIAPVVAAVQTYLPRDQGLCAG